MDRKFICDIGQAGSGKTRIGKILQKKYFNKRNVTFDLFDEYDSKFQVDTLEDLTDCIKNNLDDFSISFYPTIPVNMQSSEELQQKFLEYNLNEVCRLLFELENCSLTIEEYEYFLDRNSSVFWLNEIFRRGRHKNVSVLLISQRFPDFAIGARSQITTLIMCKQFLGYDMKLFEREYGLSIDDMSKLEKYDIATKPIEGKHFLQIGEKIL